MQHKACCPRSLSSLQVGQGQASDARQHRIAGNLSRQTPAEGSPEEDAAPRPELHLSQQLLAGDQYRAVHLDALAGLAGRLCTLSSVPSTRCACRLLAAGSCLSLGLLLLAAILPARLLSSALLALALGRPACRLLLLLLLLLLALLLLLLLSCVAAPWPLLLNLIKQRPQPL